MIGCRTEPLPEIQPPSVLANCLILKEITAYPNGDEYSTIYEYASTDSSRLKRVEYYDENELASYQTEFEYDAVNNVSGYRSVFIELPLNVVVRVSHLYDEENNLIRTTSNRTNNFQEEIYSYNEQGNINGYVFSINFAKSSENTNYSYDGNNNLLSYTALSYLFDQVSDSETYHNTYNQANQLIKAQVVNTANDSILRTQEFEYNNLGQLSNISSFLGADRKYEETRYSLYDANGNALKVEYYDFPANSLSRTETATYECE
jgi:hypothetical protein